MSSKYRKMAHNVPLSILTASILMMSSELASSGSISIDQSPLAGVSIKYAPNVVLALSVEYPTAGPAYSDSKYLIDGKSMLRVSAQDFKESYKGYFDNTKCYRFVGDATNGYFTPSSKATSDATFSGMCNGLNEFSGSVMNWLTMSALDVFRQAMTGGNRALGIESTESNYRQGDTASETFLRRAKVVYNQNGRLSDLMRVRGIRVEGNLDVIKKFLPTNYVNLLAADVIAGLNGKGLPRAAGFKEIGGIGEYTNIPVNANASFEDNNIYFLNMGFSTIPVRKLKLEGKPNYYAYLDMSAIPTSISGIGDATTRTYVQKLIDAKNAGGSLPNHFLPVVVKVCDSFQGLEESCQAYDGGHSKPEGLLQKYARNGMRVATFGYLNTADSSVDGGVLRSKMKYLIQPEKSSQSVSSPEWDSKTGQIEPNPEKAPEGNSGAINYLNKFGDSSGYKTEDPASELYYTALRYLRNKGPVYQPSSITPAMKDGFPAIYDWDDPLKSGFSEGSLEPQCRQNTIIFIGDTNTHQDFNLPNFSYSGTSPTSTPIDDIPTQAALEKVLDMEQLGSSTWSNNRGSQKSPAGMAGLAYWARTHDIRSDLPGEQYGNNFMIDVLEGGNSKANGGNSYYLAAKYGGFDNYVNGKFVTNIVDRSQWTDDAEGSSSDARNFPKGMPRNFALGNNPDNMITALQKAFKSTDRYTNPSQASIGLTTQANEVIKLGDGGSSIVLSSSFDAQKLSGDVVANRLTYNKATNSFEYTPLWHAASLMTKVFHGSNFNNRNVYAIDNYKKIVRFNADNLKQYDPNAIRYALGDPSLEGQGLRTRTNIMGTIVSPTVRSILKSDKQPAGCTYARPINNRDNFYAAAANDGMLHILDKDGNEKMAYMVSTALPKLADYAKDGATHAYLNDGTPVTKEMCFGSTAKSVLVGTAGRGGAAVYAMDVTDLSSPGVNNVLWEFSNADDADLGLTVGKASLAKASDGKPIAIISGGYNAPSNKGYIFVLDLSKPSSSPWIKDTNYWKIDLGSSGVGEVFVYDKNNDGVPDKLYAGDLDGNLWRVDYDTAKNEWKSSKLYEPTVKDRPITAAPYAQVVNDHLYVIAGTGQYLNDSGLNATQQNYAYGFFDKGETIQGDAGLLEQLTDKAVVNTDKTAAWSITKHQLQSSNQGWKLKLLPGQVVTSGVSIRKGKVAEFVAVRRVIDSNSCKNSGTTSQISVDLTDGGLYTKSALFDTNGDGLFNSTDKQAGIFEIKGLISPNASYLNVRTGDAAEANDTEKRIGSFTGDSGSYDLVINSLKDIARVRRISWRELF
ncbi:MAG: PilC/PilY family type IV pilus protein [Neisseria sp.]|uniref:pilus assembly protein n=1 Tax=Neisseria sp. TaxID=192066 RepID=UPI0026DD9DF4|nr:PilC/PilY family type IV pilus protein [Neisseria sp.]MDO4641674.1 PilC/PilY family type IV pilus protein [Neisseria sp.]